MQDFRKLNVWVRSHTLVLDIYRCTSAFPRDEQYGLTSQIRRACASIPANIAEGCGRGGNAELAHFLQIAAGSASELDYHFLLARDLALLQPADYARLSAELTEIRQMLTSLIAKLRK